MGLEAGNPVVGGTILRRAAIQSPNFKPAVQGWAINQDGSAQFSDLTLITPLATLILESGFAFIAPSGDDTGVADRTAFNNALSAGLSIQEMPGIYTFDQPISYANADIIGCGDSSINVPASTWPGGSVFVLGDNAGLRDIAGYGGSAIRADNPAADFVSVPATSSWWRVRVRCDMMNGNIVSVTPGAGSHGVIDVRGEHNSGGVRIDGGIGASVSAEIDIMQIDVQNCETNPILFLSSVTDIRFKGPFNGSILGVNTVHQVIIQGACQSCSIGDVDTGGGQNLGGAWIFQDTISGGVTFSPTEIQVGPGVIQAAQIGMVVNGGAARLGFNRVWCKRMQTDGWQFNGTGAFITLTKCGGNLNRQAGGSTVGYDINVTSTAHVLNDGFSYVSGGVTAGRNVAVSNNHYTEANAPSSLTTAGFTALGGW